MIARDMRNLALPVVVCLVAGTGLAAEPAAPAGPGAAAPVGLCVHVGCGNGRLTAMFARSGRVLVHGLDADAGAVADARAFVRSQGLYGQVCIEQLSSKRLPYAENLVNMVVAEGPTGRAVAVKEIFRVLRPDGLVALRLSAPGDVEHLTRELKAAGFADMKIGSEARRWLMGRKPWPAGMDQWGHPRHGADGNAASRDQLVGPPRRVRWVAGPMQESSNMIASGGRLFNSGLIARDAFNGLGLWARAVTPTPLRLSYSSRAAPGSVVPVASGDRVYAFSSGKLHALDGATGRTLRTYPVSRGVLEILVCGRVLVATCGSSVEAFDVDRGNRLWSFAAARPSGVVAGDGGVYLLAGASRKGGKRAIVKLDLLTGRAVWRRDEYAWAAKARRLNYHKGLLVCEVSTLSNNRPGNSIHALGAADGALAWQRTYEPGMTHYLQARAIQTGDLVWVLARGRWEGLDRRTGKCVRRHKAGGGHCYPPVASGKFLFAGEMSVTAQQGGTLDTNPISKGACGRDAGFVPANGLLYLAPKHCTCWPMLQGYTALAPERASGPWPDPAPGDFALVPGPAAKALPKALPKVPDARADWPCYRAGPCRNGAIAASVPAELEVLWTADLGGWPDVPLAGDWKQNLHVAGPVTPPVIAGGLVFAARPDAHELVALDAGTGKRRWQFTANGRIDGPPTIHRGLCLFGTRAGWVYCLRADDGRLVWRLCAGRNEQRIVSFGQIESPWPVPGSVLVVDGVAYFAAGRHPLADGGVLVFAVAPATGRIRWVNRINSLPMKSFYGGAGNEFDPFDLLAAESSRPAPAPGAKGPGGEFLAMSRWRIDRKTGKSGVMWKSGFGYYRTGGGGVMAPRGVWTYGPRMSYTHLVPRPPLPGGTRIIRRPLMVFSGGMLIGSMPDSGKLFRRDFTRAGAAKFNDEWYNQRHVPRKPDKPGDRSRSQRLARGAKWTVPAFDGLAGAGAVSAMVLAGERIFAVSRTGRLGVFAADNGRRLAERKVPPAVWDGLAAAGGSLYMTSADGKILRLGKRR